MNLGSLETEQVEIASLKPHPKNYRVHGDEQLEHLAASIRSHGFYRPVVVAKDGTILAGHGVVEACKKLGIEKVPVVRLNLKPTEPRALKILTGDNEISRLGEVDDRQLSELLKDIASSDELLGTGFDEMMLANLVFVTRPESEIKDFDAAKEWVGLPTYEEASSEKEKGLVLEIAFKTEADRDRFVEETKLKIRDRRGGRKWSTVWPFVERNDLRSVKFKSGKSNA